MATIPLTADTLISSLMPSGGGSLASGDTIQLYGHSLVVDADAVDYPVTIANSGVDCNLELRDLGRIKLNATLPSNVHPWIDPSHPLPVSAEPGIDGDPYRTPLTANARAEIQLNGNFGLGGGAASLPTETRNGTFYFNATISGTTFQSDREIDLHIGDLICPQEYHNGAYLLTAWNNETLTGTLSSSPSNMTSGYCHLLAGGVLINALTITASERKIITSDAQGGTICLLGGGGNVGIGGTKLIGFFGVSCVFDRILSRAMKDYMSNGDYASTFAVESSINTRDLAALRLFHYHFGSTSPEAGPMYNVSSLNLTAGMVFNPSFGITQMGTQQLGNAVFDFGGGVAQLAPGCVQISQRFKNMEFIRAASSSPGEKTIEIAENSIVENIGHVRGIQLEASGTVLLQENGSWYNAPATAADVTWRYTDRTVAPGTTLRLRCAWAREGSAATRASVAVTDTVTWWPGLWPIGADALASVEFTGGTTDWRSELLTWRNTSSEAVQVRVWECVTGSVAGGYLKVEEVKGGAL